MIPAIVPAQAKTHRGGPTLQALPSQRSGDQAPGTLSQQQMRPPNPARPPAASREPNHLGTGTLRSVALNGPAGRLEAVLNLGAPHAPFAALVCHPHPSFGGNLHDKVVYHAMKALNDRAWGLGWPVLRFNFRGTGLSQGTHHGEAEVGDVLAAMDWLESEFQRPLVVAGFSFGAAMALRACCGAKQTRPNVLALIALGLPILKDFSAYHYSFLRNLAVPKLFVSGDRDQFAPGAQLSRVVASAAEPKRLILLPGGDHFFTDQLEPMQRTIVTWLKEQLP